MSTSALILMVTVQASVTAITLFFFFKILRYKPKDGDSYVNED